MALIAYWNCDDLSLPTVPDSSGNGRDGTAQGDGVSAATGKVGGGLQLAGSADYVEVPHDAALALSSGDWTIALWIYPTAWDNGDGFGNSRLIAKGAANPSIGAAGWTLLLDEVGSGGVAQTFAFDVNAEGRRRAANGALSLNAWQHVAARYDSGVLQLFVGGSPSGPAYSSVGQPGASTNAVRMGSRPEKVEREYVGFLDDVRIYNEALSDAAIAAIANVQTVAIGTANVGVAGQDLQAVVEGPIATAQISVAGQPLTVSGAEIVQIGTASASIAGQPLFTLPRPLTWCDQVHDADRFVPTVVHERVLLETAAVRVAGRELAVNGVVEIATAAVGITGQPLTPSPSPFTWASERFTAIARASGSWVARPFRVSPINPFSFETSGPAWFDIPVDPLHHVFPRGVTIWLEIMLGAISARGVLLTTGGGTVDGEFSLEIQPPADGGLVRAWFVQGGAVQYFGGSSPLTGGIAGSKITPGAPTAIALTMGENGAAVAVNGVTLATLATTGTWRTVSKRLGAWIDGGGQLNFTLGDLRLYGALSPDQVAQMYESTLDWWSRLGFGVVRPKTAQVAAAGQALGVHETIVLGTAAVAVAGQALTTPAPGVVEIDTGSVAIAGQAVAVHETVALGSGAVSVAGQDLTLAMHFGTIQTELQEGSSDTYTFSSRVIDTGANKALAIVQFQPAFNANGDFSGVTATLNASSMTQLLHSLQTESNYRYGRATFFWIDSPSSGDLVLNFDVGAGTDIVVGCALTLIPIFGAPSGAGAFGATNRSDISTVAKEMPLSLVTTAPNSWVFSAATRREQTNGPFVMDDTGLMAELYDWAATGTNAGCGVIAYGQGGATGTKTVGATASSNSGNTNQLGSVAAVELLQP